VSGPSNGTLTLNANGTFSYTHNGSETTSDSFTYKVNDGTVDGNTVTVNIGVTPVNDAPVAVADSISVLEGGTATVLVSGATSVLANDSDAENSPLSAILVSGPAHGTLTLNANGTFSYTHDGSETTTDSFTYRANDGTVNGNIVTVNIGVTPVNDAPVAVADSISVLEGGTATVLVSGATSVLANDSDAENSTLRAILVNGPAHGTVTLNADGTFVYIHDGSETTTDSFTYRANDGTVNGNIVTVNIGVTPVNDAPVAVADSISVLEGGTATVLVSGATSVLANDSDAENSTLSAILVSGPAHGTLTLNANGTFSYTHDGSETTTDSFTYRANDGTVNGNIVTVNIGVTPVNDVPVAVNDTGSGAAYSVQLGDAAASDLWTNADSKGQSVTISAYKVNGATTNLYTGTVDGNANVLGVGTGTSANANNTPRTNNGGNPQSDVPNQIEYDVKTGKSEALELKLNGNINSATFGVSRLYPGESGGEVGMWQAFYKGTLVTSGTFRLGGSSNAGSFTINTGSLVFDSIKFLALGTNDGTGDGADYFLTSFSGSGPASANTNYTVAEGGTLSIGSTSSFKLLSNDTDADGDSLSVAQINGSAVTDGQTVTLASGATLLIHSNGSFDYSTGSAFNSLSAGQVTTDSFTYTVSDGHGGTSTATATMTVVGKSLTGTLGADTLVGGSYSETIMGLAGNDTMTGGAGADTFKWSLNDQGTAGTPAQDTIKDFNVAQGDVLNLKDLLQNEGAGNITNYLHFSSDGTNTTVSISSIGAFNGSNYSTAVDQTIVLNNVNLTGTDTDIINQLKNNGNLITD
jgi:VCBS repeat-containing protein